MRFLTHSPRHPLTRPLFAAALLLANGCIPPSMDPKFATAAEAPLDPAQPIVGAWQGEWVSSDASAAGPARLIVTSGGAGTDTLDLELLGFPSSDVGQRFAAEATVDPRGGPVREFSAKMPAIIVQGGLCAAALGLQARVTGDAMRIDYWVNDALQQVDSGHVDLRRAGRPTTQP